jgi:hypothetical protein
MHRHRFLGVVDQRRLPQPQAQPINMSAFCACPLSLVSGAGGAGWLWQQHVYQLAFAQAQAVVRPSLLERDLLGVWN